MIYEWGRHTFKADPQAVGETVERIASENDGVCPPSALVDAARRKRSPLHPLFEWDDERAAEAYRREQARSVVQSLVVVHEDGERRAPAFYHVSLSRDERQVRGYQPISVVASSEESRTSAAMGLLRTLKGLQRRYDALGEFADVWAAVERVEQEIAA